MKFNYIKIKKYSIPLIGYTFWCGLGFIRGVNSHKYSTNKYEKDKPYLYSNIIIEGFFGIILYGNPILLPFTVYKEVYRLESNIRNLEDEKKSGFYNDLI
jgi:hypothetical protein